MKLAVIPARGGSKRIPRKNIRSFCGKPIIAWSIAAAQESGCFDRIVVSTDDEAIAEIARQCGAEIPFMRPAALATDHAGTIPVISHAMKWLVTTGQTPDAVCCLYATAPFVTAADIQLGLAALQEQSCDYAFSVTSYPHPIQRAFRIDESNRVEMFQPEHLNTRSQDLVEAFHDAGQFYWGRPDAWLAERPIFSANSVPVVLPRHRVQDIDTAEDWTRAEWLFKTLHHSPGSI
ncbi:MAG: pseudaminic acid cytidylyltransferase [Gammaproteobacteria bacterium]